MGVADEHRNSHAAHVRHDEQPFVSNADSFAVMMDWFTAEGVTTLSGDPLATYVLGQPVSA